MPKAKNVDLPLSNYFIDEIARTKRPLATPFYFFFSLLEITEMMRKWWENDEKMMRKWEMMRKWWENEKWWEMMRNDEKIDWRDGVRGRACWCSHCGQDLSIEMQKAGPNSTFFHWKLQKITRKWCKGDENMMRTWWGNDEEIMRKWAPRGESLPKIDLLK